MITPPITFWPFDSRNSLVSRLLHGVANDSETDIAMGLMPLLCTCAAVTQGKFAVGLPRADGLHAEPLCIMGISITEASERKSTVFNCFIAPIQEIEAESTYHHKHQVGTIKTNNSNAHAVLKVLRRRYAYAKANNEDTAELEQEITKTEVAIQDIPSPLKLVVKDVRGTAFAREIARQTGTRLAVFDGEGGSLEPIIKERQLLNFIADGFNGDGASFLRESKPSIEIAHAYISLCIMLQPEKLKRLTGKSHLWHEGFMARVLPVFVQPRAGQRFGQHAVHDAQIYAWFHNKISELHKYPWNANQLGNIAPHVLQLGPQATAQWITWKNQLEQMQSPSQPTHLYKAWYGKMAGITARVAALIHLMETNNDPVASPISEFHMGMAIKLIQALGPHMNILYEVLCPNPVVGAAFHLARWVACTQGYAPYFSLSAAIKNTKLTAVDAHMAAHYLVNMGALTPIEAIQGFDGKRSGPQFAANYPILQQVLTSLQGLKA